MLIPVKNVIKDVKNFYHLTLVDNLDSIKKEGLKVSKDGFVYLSSFKDNLKYRAKNFLNWEGKKQRY